MNKEKLRQEKAVRRVERESQMMKHLEENGWKQSGLFMDVWKIPSWGSTYKTEVCMRTLHQACEIQVRRDSNAKN